MGFEESGLGPGSDFCRVADPTMFNVFFYKTIIFNENISKCFKNSPFRILVVVSGSGTDEVASPEAAAGVLNLISRRTEPSSSITVRVWT